MERLIKRDTDGEILIKVRKNEYLSICFCCERIGRCKNRCYTYNAILKLFYYEDLEEQKGIEVDKLYLVGTEKKIAGLVWKVLDVTEKGLLCLAERLPDDMRFDRSCNNWQKSSLRNYLNTEFYQKLAAEAGEENIVPFERDLLSLDGQTEYGTCEDKVSLLNLDEYRKYRRLIPNAEYYWWLITPDSTKCNDDSVWIALVSPAGRIYGDNCDDGCGVRPVCIFSPAIIGH